MRQVIAFGITVISACFLQQSSAFLQVGNARASQKSLALSMLDDSADDRRQFLIAASTAAFVTSINPGIVFASGGATAGKYTTIPIAKRRYYGRVSQAVHEFLLMEKSMVGKDMTAAPIQDFFDVTKTVIQEAKKTSINGQCTKADGKCKGKEIRDSRWNDMKTSMYLLGNAFRINQTKAPDNLPTVMAAKKFFKEMDAIEKAVVKKPKKRRHSNCATLCKSS